MQFVDSMVCLMLESGFSVKLRGAARKLRDLETPGLIRQVTITVV